MRSRRTFAAFGSSVLAATGLTVLSLTTPAQAEEPTAFEQAHEELSSTVDPSMLEALSEELDLPHADVMDRLATAKVGAWIEQSIQFDLGDSYAGTWVSEDVDEIFVATTDSAAKSDITAQGATPVVVDHSYAQLDTWKADLDAVAHNNGVSSDVYSWAVDVDDNGLTVSAANEDVAAEFIAAADVDPNLVTVEIDDLDLELAADIRGGEAYWTSQYRCSVGFSSTHPTYGDGFTTAGHCGGTGEPISDGTGSGGQFRHSTFPGQDIAWVEAGSSWEAAPLVYTWGQGDRQVHDGTEAPVGADICRSGSTTNWQCGQVQGKNESVNYPEGTVGQLTRTSTCAEGGDSGGAFISGNSAQGQTSGGQTGCPGSGPIWFSTLSGALNLAGATLTTTGNGEEDGFAISLSPNNLELDPGSEGNVSLNSETLSGQPQNLNLSATGAPSGVSLAFESDTITSGQSTSVNVVVKDYVADGTYTITVSAMGSEERTADLTLTVGDDGGDPGGSWEPWTQYSAGDQVTYGGSTYECRISHTSLPGWEPPTTPSLWQEV
ncbi:carbohydrate-binding protein [Haloglycomyces albus]|uniref:carbohydrate-binding protein n=1 Tax=Haloglycomyces albus TaxID=526067 RepID=UPI00046CAEC4|nr:carbohydrate-binding protein [Haloglycomyces albus]